MIKDRTSFFKRLAQLPALKNNLLSLILAKNPNIDLSKREQFVDNVRRFYTLHDFNERKDLDIVLEDNTSTIDSWVNLDLRIKNLKLQSLRCFPKNNTPYGINFLNSQGDISSMIILGGNATGKSSIYGALEYVFCKRIGEAELRSSETFKDDDEKFQEFLRHFHNPYSNTTCDVNTVSKSFKINEINIPVEVRKKINPNTHFLSDFDIYEFGRLNYQNKGDFTFQNLIAKNVGLSEFLEIEKHLYNFISYKRLIESTAVHKLHKEIARSKETIENNIEAIDQKVQQETELRQNSFTPNSSNNVRTSLELLEQIKNFNFTFQFNINDFKNTIEAFKNNYAKYTTNISKNFSLQEIQFLEIGLVLMDENDTCPFCNSSHLNKQDLHTHVNLKLEELKEISTLSKELNASLNNIIEYFKGLHSYLITIRAKNNECLKKINKNSDFNELLQLTIAFESYLSNSILNDFFGDILDIESNTIYNKDKLGFISSIISRHESFLNNDLLKNIMEISKFETKRNTVVSEIETKLKIKTSVSTSEGQIAILKKEIESLTTQNIQITNELKLKETQLLNAIELQEFYNRVKIEALEYYNIAKIELAKETQAAFQPIKEIVTNILSEYLYEEERPVQLIIETKPDVVDDETGEIISEILVAYLKELNSNNPPISVNKYFNTFHFRLFCTMVGISIAVASRKSTGINLPLMLDDIFYTSDFENRATIERFIKRLFELFKKHTPTLPLQLILFTHDQMIFESTISATKENQITNILFAKLFPYQESSPQDGFNNLINLIPAHLQYEIMQNQLIKNA